MWLKRFTGAEPAGDRLSVEFEGIVLYKVSGKYSNNQSCKRASVGGGSGPLIPRASGFNGGIVFDASRFARNFAVGNTPCGVLY